MNAPDIETRFGDLGDEYEAFRHGYADAAYDVLAARWGVRAGAEVVDVGCGTGLATRVLAGRGVRVTGVEPDAGMRERAQRLLGPDVRVLDGQAERLPLGDASVDGVVAAQAAHWFSEPAASEEIRRVLRPGGAAAYMWKRPHPQDPYEPFVDEHLYRYAGTTAGPGLPLVWTPLLADGWVGYGRDVVDQDIPYTVDSYVGRLRSSWSFTQAAGEHLEAVLGAVRRDLERVAPDGRFVERNLVYVFGARTPA